MRAFDIFAIMQMKNFPKNIKMLYRTYTYKQMSISENFKLQNGNSSKVHTWNFCFSLFD